VKGCNSWGGRHDLRIWKQGKIRIPCVGIQARSSVVRVQKNHWTFTGSKDGLHFSSWGLVSASRADYWAGEWARVHQAPMSSCRMQLHFCI
jgi:hypothetical protein